MRKETIIYLVDEEAKVLRYIIERYIQNGYADSYERSVAKIILQDLPLKQ